MGFSAKIRITSRERRHQMFEMQMIGRADHHQIEVAIFEQRLHVGIDAARRDVMALQDRQPDGRRIDIARDVEPPAHFLHRRQHMRDPLPKPDDADAIGFHGASVTKTKILHAEPRSTKKRVSARANFCLFTAPTEYPRFALGAQCVGVQGGIGFRVGGAGAGKASGS